MSEGEKMGAEHDQTPLLVGEYSGEEMVARWTSLFNHLQDVHTHMTILSSQSASMLPPEAQTNG